MVPTASGKGQAVSRCPACRTALWSNYAGFGEAIRFVRVGALDAPDQMPPDIHIHGASKQAWVVLAEGVPVVPGYYVREEVWGVESLERLRRLVG